MTDQQTQPTEQTSLLEDAKQAAAELAAALRLERIGADIEYRDMAVGAAREVAVDILGDRPTVQAAEWQPIPDPYWSGDGSIWEATALIEGLRFIVRQVNDYGPYGTLFLVRECLGFHDTVRMRPFDGERAPVSSLAELGTLLDHDEDQRVWSCPTCQQIKRDARANEDTPDVAGRLVAALREFLQEEVGPIE